MILFCSSFAFNNLWGGRGCCVVFCFWQNKLIVSQLVYSEVGQPVGSYHTFAAVTAFFQASFYFTFIWPSNALNTLNVAASTLCRGATRRTLPNRQFNSLTNSLFLFHYYALHGNAVLANTAAIKMIALIVMIVSHNFYRIIMLLFFGQFLFFCLNFRLNKFLFHIQEIYGHSWHIHFNGHCGSHIWPATFRDCTALFYGNSGLH